jgi:hypothetical protein
VWKAFSITFKAYVQKFKSYIELKYRYFFTIDKSAVIARDHSHTAKKNPRWIKNIEMYDEMRDYTLPIFNYRIWEQGQVLDNWYIPLLSECIPRQRQLKYRKQIQYRVKEEWKVEKSVFADYQSDSNELMDKIFENDWSLMQPPKFDKQEDLEKAKQILKKFYWTIRDAFKYYASISSSTGSWTFALTLNSYTDYLKQAGVYKNKTVNFTDTDTLFFTTNKREKPTFLNPGNAVIRYQFLEIMLRIGLKYGKAKDSIEGLKDFWVNVIEKSLKFGKSEDFRNTRYWTLEWDNVFRHHIHLFKEVYSNYSGAITKPGEENFMSPGEFEKIFLASGLLNANFANRDVYVWFNLAMQSRIDEYASDSHLKMTFIEFIEAVARAAEYLSLGPPSDHVREAYLEELHQDDTKIIKASQLLENSKFPEEEDEIPADLADEEGAYMTESEHVHQPLHKKVEHLIPYLLAHWTSKAFKKKWKWPRKNPHTGLFTDVREEGVKEVKSMMVKGINKLIFSRFNLKEIVKKKNLNIKLRGM